MFKKTLLPLLLSCIAMLGSAQSAKTVTNLNLRNGPSTEYSILETIPKAEEVEILSCFEGWCKVRYGYQIGYVNKKYIFETSNTHNTVSTKLQNYNYEYVEKEKARAQEIVRYYTNSYGNRVQSPTSYSSQPEGACAICGDGTYSFSQNRRGTCSRHGGVATWLR